MNLFKSIILQFVLLFFCLTVHSQQLAFPGAEGFGKYTTGGRGGSVYHVTNLNDAGPGSFRDAVSKPNRIVVFEVGGVINISSRIVVNKNITIAGQTAPGDGITIYGNGVAFNGDSGNDIVRYIRIRMGKNGDATKDAISISDDQHNYIFDHVSVSWGRDGTFDANTKSNNITVQDCIIGQGINLDNHSTGGLIQCGPISFIRTLWIDNKTRNPKIRFQHEFINCVLYNWASDGYIMGDTEGVSECNLLGNYFVYGPASVANSHITRTTPTFNIYAEDNWVDANKDGELNGSLLSGYKTATLVNTPFKFPGVDSLLTAQQAVESIIHNAGASIARDEVDAMLIDQLVSFGTKGAIITTEDNNGITNNVGIVKGGLAPLDTDRDGMPDEWEFYYGLNPLDKSDQNQDFNGDGYTNIEEYLNGTDPGFGDGLPSNDTFLIEVYHSNLVLAGDTLRQKTYSEGFPENWLFSSINDTIYFIKDFLTGKYISVQDGSEENGALIVTADSTGEGSQQWKLTFIGEGLYEISNVKSGKSLSVKEGAMDENTTIIQEDFSNRPYQKFRIYYNTIQVAKPIVIMKSPLPGNITLGSDVFLEATAEDYDGEVQYVDFMVNDVLLYRDSIQPYRYIWHASASGNHIFKVMAIDNDGNMGSSSEITLAVLGSQPDYLLIQENRNGYCFQEGTIDSNHGGFTGEGFVNCDNAVAKGVEWKIEPEEAGSVQVNFRYANGADNRPGKIIVNGQDAIASLDFPGTGAWTTWKTVTANVALSAGTNIVRLEALGSGGLANIDYILFEDRDIVALNCKNAAVTGKLTIEYFNEIPGNLIEDLVFHAGFPTNPDTSFYLSKLEAPLNKNDNFGARVRGFLHPSKSGAYTFWLSGDEACQLWLSADSTPANAQKLVVLDKPTDIREWDKYPEQRSSSVELIAGDKYYIEIVQKENDGTDNLSVAWSGPGYDKSVIEGEHLSHWTGDDPVGVNYTGVKHVNLNTDLKIYPNPSGGRFTISFNNSQQPTNLEVYDLSGKVVASKTISGSNTTLHLDELYEGVYFVRFVDGDSVFTGKIVLKR